SLPEQDGWFWYIPLHDDLVSVGVVADPEFLFGGRRNPALVLEEEIARTSAMARRLTSATRVSEVHVLSDFTYRSTRVAGDGWVLIGDAFGFLDPIYSSGVFLALKTGELAADAIVEGFAKNDLSAAQLGKWIPDFTRGMDRMKRLVYAFYEGFTFGGFIRKHPEMKRHI